MSEVRLDGVWRPEEHPHREGVWLVARYVADLGKPSREVYAQDVAGRQMAVAFPTEDAAQRHADLLNPAPPPREWGGELSEAQLLWLQRLAEAPEGRMENALMRTLLGLEALGFAKSTAEPGRRRMDRWTITEEGRAALARHKH